MLLLSEGLLTRPWCLLEINEAMKQQRPVVLLNLKGRRFSFEGAHTLLADIEREMPKHNADCLGALRAHLGGQSLDELARAVVAALAKGAEQKVVLLDMNGSSHQLEAGLLDLVECLASATQRSLRWRAPALKKSKTSFMERRPRSVATKAETGLLHILYHEADATDHAVRLQEGFPIERCAAPRTQRAGAAPSLASAHAADGPRAALSCRAGRARGSMATPRRAGRSPLRCPPRSMRWGRSSRASRMRSSCCCCRRSTSSPSRGC